MSGNNGPSGGGMFTGGPESDDCSALRLSDSVASPDPSYTFVVGVFLDVVVNAGPPVTVSLLGGGMRVGSLHPLPALVRCLNQGVLFRAEVLSAIGGDIRVRVEPVP
ncbi:MAG: hypothetical protein J0H23_00335 [Micrococcales bacterium]|nr:hypothetical protein [Micrococcales bacterium]